MLPIYWLINMSFKTTNEILGAVHALSAGVHARQLHHDLHRPDLVYGLRQLADLRVLNTVISVAVALPAAYAFSRYRFLGDKHLFFWLLTNRMAPPAVFALPFFQLYSAVGPVRHASSRWRWRTACSTCRWRSGSSKASCRGVPKEIDETAYIDGYSFPRFFVKIFMPTDRLGHRRRGVLLLHVLMGGAAARAHADGGRRQADRGNHDPHGLGLGL
jgi:glycerol transport system permease protein